MCRYTIPASDDVTTRLSPSPASLSPLRDLPDSAGGLDGLGVTGGAGRQVLRVADAVRRVDDGLGLGDKLLSKGKRTDLMNIAPYSHFPQYHVALY